MVVIMLPGARWTSIRWRRLGRTSRSPCSMPSISFLFPCFVLIMACAMISPFPIGSPSPDSLKTRETTVFQLSGSEGIGGVSCALSKTAFLDRPLPTMKVSCLSLQALCRSRIASSRSISWLRRKSVSSRFHTTCTSCEQEVSTFVSIKSIKLARMKMNKSKGRVHGSDAWHVVKGYCR